MQCRVSGEEGCAALCLDGSLIESFGGGRLAASFLPGGGIPFMVTLPKAPQSVNADFMGVEEIHEKLQEGYRDVELGKVQDAAAAFVKFRESH